MMWWLRAATDLVLPRVCPPCGRTLPPGAPSVLCPACRVALVGFPRGACPRCAGVTATPQAPCAACRIQPPVFVSARALGLYVAGPPANVLARTVQQLKYHGARALAGPLADALALHYPFAASAVLVPVPLHVSRLRQRDYNQALLLARGLARRRRLVLAPRLLERTRATAEHATLGAAARRANVRDAIRVRAGARCTPQVAVLIDDVFTTGATADACARALRAAGVRAVHVYTVGRTP